MFNQSALSLKCVTQLQTYQDLVNLHSHAGQRQRSFERLMLLLEELQRSTAQVGGSVGKQLRVTNSSNMVTKEEESYCLKKVFRYPI